MAPVCCKRTAKPLLLLPAIPGIPKVMHYGLLFDVNGYKFDKHWHYGFNVMTCPPWSLDDDGMQRRSGGIFNPPPPVSEVKKYVSGEREARGGDGVQGRSGGIFNPPPPVSEVKKYVKKYASWRMWLAERALMGGKLTGVGNRGFRGGGLGGCAASLPLISYCSPSAPSLPP
jgi:hypothetical protein